MHCVHEGWGTRVLLGGDERGGGWWEQAFYAPGSALNVRVGAPLSRVSTLRCLTPLYHAWLQLGLLPDLFNHPLSACVPLQTWAHCRQLLCRRLRPPPRSAAGRKWTRQRRRRLCLPCPSASGWPRRRQSGTRWACWKGGWGGSRGTAEGRDCRAACALISQVTREPVCMHPFFPSWFASLLRKGEAAHTGGHRLRTEVGMHPWLAGVCLDQLHLCVCVVLQKKRHTAHTRLLRKLKSS
jgi:hypothetical protein